ncbi:MAG: hypothetical protein N2489_07610 [Clostridia bacterium]|nr:hypothetical protein [Clostridia bacterium]
MGIFWKQYYNVEEILKSLEEYKNQSTLDFISETELMGILKELKIKDPLRVK